LARLNVDLVHTTGAIVGRPADIATVHFCHAAFREVTGGPAPSGGAFWRRVNRRISRVLALAGERWCYRGARLSLLAAVSDSASEELSRYYPGVPVAITPNGVDVARFRPNGGMRSLERAAHGVTPGSIVALFVGGDWSRKGLDLAIEAVALLTRSGDSGVCLWVAGRGERARYFQQAKHLGVADRVQFLGVRTDIEKLYQAADVLVLPSSYETFSLVAYEAAACGLPIVATACHGVAELVGNDEAGVLVERTPHALALALGRLAEDGPLRTRMGEAGRRRCISFTWERSAESVLSLYRTLLARDALSSAIP
jgi:glycosyltransferase involved in cell wall biosynthesis